MRTEKLCRFLRSHYKDAEYRIKHHPTGPAVRFHAGSVVEYYVDNLNHNMCDWVFRWDTTVNANASILISFSADYKNSPGLRGRGWAVQNTQLLTDES